MLVGLYLSLWAQTQSKGVKGLTVNWAVMNCTFISPCVSILCLRQDVIAEDARESLPSCPFDPAMVTWLTLADLLAPMLHTYSCAALCLSKHN